jgi:hypothetical protein
MPDENNCLGAKSSSRDEYEDSKLVSLFNLFDTSAALEYRSRKGMESTIILGLVIFCLSLLSLELFWNVIDLATDFCRNDDGLVSSGNIGGLESQSKPNDSFGNLKIS